MSPSTCCVAAENNRASDRQLDWPMSLRHQGDVKIPDTDFKSAPNAIHDR